ncbi:uncharacterized protein LOC144439052 [Glandiceps talaboti]
MKQWPELVGKTGEEAKEVVLKECHDFKIQIIPTDSMVTCDFVPTRVRIFVSDNGKVARPPKVG